MKKLSNKVKIALGLITFALIIISAPFILYLKVLPYAVSHEKTTEFAQQYLKESTGLDLTIKKPVLTTDLTPVIGFKTDEISINKNNIPLFKIKNLEAVVSFSEIFDKKIILKKIGMDYIFADVNKLSELAPPPQKEAKPFDWSIAWFDSLLYIKKCLIVYKAAPDTFVKVTGNDMQITERRNPKYVNFKLSIDVKKNKDKLSFSILDNKNVFIKDRKLFIKDCLFSINNSKIFINAVADEKNNFDLSVSSKKFDVKNAVNLINSNLVIPNGNEMLVFFKNIKGDFDFNINLTKNDMQGSVDLNRLSLDVVPLNNMPLTMNTGKAKITKDLITLQGFDGYYGKNQINKIDFNGTVKDYYKSVDTDITATALATNEFAKDYLSKVAGCPLELVGTTKTKLLIKSVYNKIDLVWLFGLQKGKDFLVDGASLSPVGYDRGLKADMHIEGNIIDIKSINYFIASVLTKESKVEPILTIDGRMNIVTGAIHNLGFKIPKPLPSEFLNVLIGQKLFKKGTIAGNLHFINTGKTPRLDGTLSMEKVRIPSQRLSIKKGSLSADKNLININALGKFKRSDYKLDGNIKNEIIFPVIVKNIDLTVDNINVEKMLQSMNNQNTAATVAPEPTPALVSASAEDDDEAYTFDTGLLIVEDCALNVVKGAYKDINFGNLKAILTLDKNGILEVKSNKFDFAEGISTLKVLCDLKKHDYYIRLGIKDINSDLIATTLLALKKEISGKANGLIELNTDDSLKLNGVIRFAVKNGTIGKVGLIEYALNFAALFRNPMAMISPSTIVDLVNIPEGNFDKINGDLVIKDNVIEKIMIKSSSPQLSSYIAGRFDLEARDASLRIYTKFSNKNKGLAGVLRNISLNSLANKVPLSSRNDSNYYSAELVELPPIEADEKDCQVFLTKVDGDIERFNFLSSLKKIK